METAPVKYAIVDGAVEEGLLDFLNEVNPPHCCLYAEPTLLSVCRTHTAGSGRAGPLSRGSCSGG